MSSGYNTDMALRVISKAIPRPEEGRIRLMTIFFGANDSCFPTENNNQCVPLPDFRSNLIKIIRNPIVADHNARIILITNPPVDERTQYAMDKAKGYPMRRTAENTMRYAEAIKSVGKSLNVPVVDLWTEIMLKAGWRPGQTDRLPGCTDEPPNAVLHEYLFDGKCSRFSSYLC
jgi:lysophospholipase L1-like esterase